MSARSQITSHVLDAATGTPAAGVPVTLAHLSGDGWVTIAEAVTDADGRVSQFGPEGVPVAASSTWLVMWLRPLIRRARCRAR